VSTRVGFCFGEAPIAFTLSQGKARFLRDLGPSEEYEFEVT
jgi:hypothetical protein